MEETLKHSHMFDFEQQSFVRDGVKSLREVYEHCMCALPGVNSVCPLLYSFE